jgi:ketosteroid isomerase-like protein
MRGAPLFALIVAFVPAVAFGQDDDAKAKTLAQEILDRGAALFDTRDAAAMAATYVDDAEIIVIKRATDSNRVVLEITRGRTDIEKAYAGIFKDRQPEHKCRNTVETARFLGPNLLLIHGRFALDREQSDIGQFVQIRARENEGDPWKIVTMQLTLLPAKNP